ncbi:MAG: hypothetical protein CMJ58_03260 [Planctomycetaceae bacterium]|nr:hypothetical protein [Planctomycetaceae bacterium]
MRQILCDHVAARKAAKRGGDWARIDLTVADPAAPAQLVDAVEIHDSLEELRRLDDRKADVVTLRFLAGCRLPRRPTRSTCQCARSS